MRVLLLEDHVEAQLWLSDALRMAFGDDTSIVVTGTVAAARDHILNHGFDLFVVDMHLPDGSGQEALIFCKQKHPEIPVVVATIYSDDAHLFPAIRAGATGYLLKDDPKKDIADMLSGILRGAPPLSPTIAQRLMMHFQEPEGFSEAHQLTRRERETLNYIVKGTSIRECAELMGISPHTVSGYLKEIYRKLQVTSRAEVTLEAMRLGLVQN